jgi:hypothetical protein
MNLTTLNEDALMQAATFIVGPDATNAIIKLYQLLDRTSYAGYELGRVEGKEAAEDNINEAFDNGYELGQDDLEDASDDGYLDGVRDARAQPALADQIVEDILIARGLEALYDEGLVQDSGDEA